MPQSEKERRASRRLYWQRYKKTHPVQYQKSIDDVYKYRYGITKQDKQTIIEKQQGLCAICGNALKTGKGGAQLDHCHKTGKIRGVLCMPCNVFLGKIKDDPTKLIAYLIK